MHRGPMYVRLATLCVLLGLLALTPVAGAARGETLLVSRASGAAGAAADGASGYVTISSGGRFVAFESDADNLSSEDDNASRNIFLRDMQSGTTILVSRANGPSGPGADGNSGFGASASNISSDGRFVAFDSDADNLSAEDDDVYRNIFVRDVQAGTTTLVSRAAGAAGASADGSSFAPTISADGRYVAFYSLADNLSADDDNAQSNVFVRDLQAGTTTLASRVSGASGAAADGGSSYPAISGDGRYVAFESGADNLSAEDSNAVTNIFVRDLQAATTTLVSRATGASGAGGDGSSSSAATSGDGRYVAFASAGDNLSAEDSNAVTNIFVRDVQSATTTLASRATGAAGAAADGNSSYVSISADGRYAVFLSDADNLSADDSNAFGNDFLRDLQTGTTTLVSRANGAAGAGADAGAYEPVLSADGRFVAFTSESDNLSPEDDNKYANIFRRDVLGAPPRCSDGAASADHNTPTPVPLTCVEDDGDPVTRVIVARPGHGSLGPVDQPAGTVVYTPQARFAGSDTFTFRATDFNGSSNTATVTLTVRLLPGRCANQLTGTRGRDRMSGTVAGDKILGLSGADVLNGVAGADCVYGGAGADRVAGGSGNDSLLGGLGNDRLVGGGGRNSYSGGAGRDTILAANAYRDLIDCGPGKDTVRADRRDRVRRCERVRRVGARR